MLDQEPVAVLLVLGPADDRPTDVTPADEVYADSAGIHTGKTFEVLLVRDEAGQGHHLALDVRLVQPETT